MRSDLSPSGRPRPPQYGPFIDDAPQCVRKEMRRPPRALDDDLFVASEEERQGQQLPQNHDAGPAVQFAGPPLWLSKVRDVNAWHSFTLAKRPYYVLLPGAQPAKAISAIAGPIVTSRPFDVIVQKVTALAGADTNAKLGYWDPTLQRTVRLQRWRDYARLPEARAVLHCLLQVQAYMPRQADLDQCLNHAVASLCFEAGFLVKRDGDVAMRLRDAIPQYMRQETLQATQEYLDHHSLFELRDRALSVEDFYADAQIPSTQGLFDVFARPNLWPGYLADQALGVLNWLF